MRHTPLLLAAVIIACAAPRRHGPSHGPSTGPLFHPGPNPPPPCPKGGDFADCIAASVGLLKDHGLAASVLRRRCTQDDAEACYLLAHLALAGKGTPASDGNASVLLAGACGMGYAPACRDLAVLAETGRAKVGDATPMELLERACAGDDGRACYRLGTESLTGPARDPGRALELFERACQGSLVMGCFEAGVLLERDEGGDKDIFAAFQRYSRACSGGDLRGCNAAGVHLMYGRGIPINTVDATTYFERACTGGLREACANLELARSHPPN